MCAAAQYIISEPCKQTDGYMGFRIKHLALNSIRSHRSLCLFSLISFERVLDQKSIEMQYSLFTKNPFEREC